MFATGSPLLGVPHYRPLIARLHRIPSNLGLLFGQELHVRVARRFGAVILRAGIGCEESTGAFCCPRVYCARRRAASVRERLAGQTNLLHPYVWVGQGWCLTLTETNHQTKLLWRRHTASVRSSYHAFCHDFGRFVLDGLTPQRQRLQTSSYRPLWLESPGLHVYQGSRAGCAWLRRTSVRFMMPAEL